MMWIWIGLQYCMMTSSVDYFTVHVLNDVDMDWSTVLYDDVLCGLFYSTCIE